MWASNLVANVASTTDKLCITGLKDTLDASATPAQAEATCSWIQSDPFHPIEVTADKSRRQKVQM